MERINGCVASLLGSGSKPAVFFSGNKSEAAAFTAAFPKMGTVDDTAKNTDDNGIAATKFLHDEGITGPIAMVTFPVLADGAVRSLLHHAQLPSERVYPAFQANAEIAADAAVQDGWINAKLKAQAADDWAGKFNFSPAWEAPEGPFVYGVGAPGVAQIKIGDRSITSATVKSWADFVKGKGITHIICLLNEVELGCYDQVTSYEAALAANGLQVTFADISKDPRARDKMLQAVLATQAAGEKIAFHCKEGVNRTGVALGTALASGQIGGRAGCTPDEAVTCIKEAAGRSKAFRRPNAKGIQIMLDDGYAPKW